MHTEYSYCKQHMPLCALSFSVINIRSTSARLFAGMWHPLVSVITTLYCVAIILHLRVWYSTLSLRYVCIQISGIILIP